jgi:peptidoglycan/LPS O-acetylase OafA/YrhL
LISADSTFQSKRRTDIQILRGIAVTAIVLFHIDKDLFPLGYLGVDVFFVVSGYVVTPLIVNIFIPSSSESIKNRLLLFYKKRFYRLVPALLATLIISSFFMFLFAPIFDHYSIGMMGLSSIFLIGNWGAYKLQGDYFSIQQNPFTHTWSLSVEEQIYLLIPLICLILFILVRPTVRSFYYIFISLLVISFITVMPMKFIQDFIVFLGLANYEMFVFYSAVSRIWEFSLGSLIYMYSKNLKSNKVRALNHKCFRTGFPIIILFVILFFPISIKLNNLIQMISATVITCILIVFKSFESILKRLSFFVWLGDRSYSIYLIHMPVIYLLNLRDLEVLWFFKPVKIMIVFLIIAVLGNLLFKSVENAYRYYYKRPPRFKILSIHSRISLTFMFTALLLFSLTFYRGTGGIEMNNDGECKIWVPGIQNLSGKTFDECYLRYGKSVIVLGDSHAMNLYNSLYYQSDQKFIIGVSAGGCRPYAVSSVCDYNKFKSFAIANMNKISEVYYHQSGSYFISDLNGKVDTDLAFKNRAGYRIVLKDIYSVRSYLSQLSKYVKVKWVGPFNEARIKPSWFDLTRNKVKINPNVISSFSELDYKISALLSNSQYKIEYISLNKLPLVSSQDFSFSNCIRFRDTDHWSRCAEKIYSQELSVVLRGK